MHLHNMKLIINKDSRICESFYTILIVAAIASLRLLGSLNFVMGQTPKYGIGMLITQFETGARILWNTSPVTA